MFKGKKAADERGERGAARAPRSEPATGAARWSALVPMCVRVRAIRCAISWWPVATELLSCRLYVCLECACVEIVEREIGVEDGAQRGVADAARARAAARRLGRAACARTRVSAVRACAPDGHVRGRGRRRRRRGRRAARAEALHVRWARRARRRAPPPGGHRRLRGDAAGARFFRPGCASLRGRQCITARGGADRLERHSPRGRALSARPRLHVSVCLSTRRGPRGARRARPPSTRWTGACARAKRSSQIVSAPHVRRSAIARVASRAQMHLLPP